MPEALQTNAAQNESLIAAPETCMAGADWFALQTRARWERKVCTQVEGKGHVAYVPVLRQRRRWSDRFQIIEVPLFPGYVFVREVSNHNDRLAILQTNSVHGFVNFSGMIARIPERQIADLRRIEEQSTGCTPWPFLKAGQRVRIRGGCLDGLEGIFVAEGTGNRLVISIIPMQRSIAVSLEDYDFEVIGSKRLMD